MLWFTLDKRLISYGRFVQLINLLWFVCFLRLLLFLLGWMIRLFSLGCFACSGSVAVFAPVRLIRLLWFNSFA